MTNAEDGVTASLRKIEHIVDNVEWRETGSAEGAISEIAEIVKTALQRASRDWDSFFWLQKATGVAHEDAFDEFLGSVSERGSSGALGTSERVRFDAIWSHVSARLAALGETL